MLKTLQKQLQQERRSQRPAQLDLVAPPTQLPPRPAPPTGPRPVVRSPTFPGPRLAAPLARPQPALPREFVPTEPELPAGPLPPELLAQLERVRAIHPRLHHSLVELNEAQLTAVLAPDAAALLRAPVGSGKTTVLVHKVLYLHLVQGVPLQAIALLTFTNRAAAEIRARIEQLADGTLTAADFWLTGTFHGVAKGLLCQVLPIQQLGYTPDFTVLDETEKELLLEQLIGENRLRVGRRSQLRTRLRIPRPGAAADALGVARARLAVLYGEAKLVRNAMDFDDLITHATALLPHRQTGETDASPDSLAALGGKLPPRFILVDEMQDCEPRELEFLQRLRGPQTGFFAVGDPHQAIYGWRGSAPGLFARAEADFGCRAYALTVNYRSTRTIVDGARAVLGLQPTAGSAPNTLRAARSPGPRIVIRRHHDPVAEALYLGERLLRLHQTGVPYREIAILYRLRAQAEPIRAALTDRGIPCAETEEPTPDAVRLLTLHAAKGLEFRYTFLSGINQGLCPLGRDNFCNDAEERRLLFVGLTRARDEVEISYHTRPHQVGALGEPSSYLSFFPAALVDWSDAPGRPAVAIPAEAIAAAAESPLATPLVPSAPQTAEPPPTAASPWQKGQSVRHPRYGEGIVVDVTSSTISCTFGKLGAKSFPIALCPLTHLARPAHGLVDP